MANAVHELAKRTPGKEAMAIESFAKALMMVSVYVCVSSVVVYMFCCICLLVFCVA